MITFLAQDIFCIQQEGVGSRQERERERERERESVWCGVWAEKSCGVSLKFDFWSSIYEGLQMG